MASSICLVTLFGVVARVCRCAPRRGHDSRHPGVWILVVFVSWTGFAAWGADSAEFGADRAQHIQALHNPCLKGRIVTCYTPGYRTRAVFLQQFLTGELAFVRQRLGISVPLVLAVLDEHQWPLAEHELPYAMPSVHGDPPIALVVPGSHWLDEFLASYVWYAYISERHPEQLWLFDVLQAGNQLERPQRFITLAELDKNYRAIVESDMQTNNYGWYQGQLIERVRRIYPVRGLDFLQEIRAAFPPGEAPRVGTDEALHRVARIDPSFGEWANELAVKPRVQDAAP
jgi:hypothetical protein